MAQADAEDRIFTEQLGDRLHRIRHILRVPRAVRQLDTIGVQTADFVRCHIMRHNNHVAAAAVQLAQDTRLRAVVNQHDPFLVSRAAVGLSG
ncbi:hypothetical protein D3C81_2076150 [compost metagenome]